MIHRIKYAPSRITSLKYLKTGDLNLKHVNQEKRAMSIKQILKLVVKQEKPILSKKKLIVSSRKLLFT